MTRLAVIGGTGLDQLDSLHISRRETLTTPYGEPSAPLSYGELNGHALIFLPRHGDAHHLPPHQINYRANLWALQQAGAEQIIAIAAVGGISAQMAPGSLALPDQIIDYTYGREHTFFDGQHTTADGLQVEHIDFTQPYCETLRQRLLAAAHTSNIDLTAQAVYGATQGPRLESSAEIRRMARDGCDVVGMTGMPEAALARELGLCYAACAVVVNWAAGLTAEPITMDEISRHLVTGMAQVKQLLEAVTHDTSH